MDMFHAVSKKHSITEIQNQDCSIHLETKTFRHVILIIAVLRNNSIFNKLTETEMIDISSDMKETLFPSVHIPSTISHIQVL